MEQPYGNLIVLSPPMLPQARNYLKRKGCVFVAVDGLDQIIFPQGCERSFELFPRVSHARYIITFPDGSSIYEQRAETSILSLPIEEEK